MDFTMASASSMSRQVMMDSAGPNISWLMSGSSMVTPVTTVGSIWSVAGLRRPPMAIFEPGRRSSMRPHTMSKCFWLIMWG